MPVLVGTVLSLALVAMMSVPVSASHNGEQLPVGCYWIRGTDTPEEHADDVSACRQNVWFHAPEGPQGRVGNVAVPSWSTTPPRDRSGVCAAGDWPESYAFAAGLSTAGDPGAFDPRFSFVAEGSFTGVLDMTWLRLYAWVPPEGYYQDLQIQLIIDGEVLFEGWVSSSNARSRHCGNDPIPPIPDEPYDFRVIDTGFTNIYEAMRQREVPNGKNTQHVVSIAVMAFPIESSMVVAYDAEDLASGLVFNACTYCPVDLAARP